MVPPKALMTVPRWVMLMVPLKAPMTARQTVFPMALQSEPESMAEVTLVVVMVVATQDSEVMAAAAREEVAMVAMGRAAAVPVLAGLAVVKMVAAAREEVAMEAAERVVEAKAGDIMEAVRLAVGKGVVEKEAVERVQTVAWCRCRAVFAPA